MKDKNPLHFNFYIVAVIDLLGQSKILNSYTGLPSSGKNDYAEFLELGKKTFGSVLYFREAVLSVNNIIGEELRIPIKVRELLTDRHVELIHLNKTVPEIKVQFLSDMAVLKLNLFEQSSFSPLISLHRLFSQLSIWMLTFLSGGVPLRGAIDIGICAELADNDLYGQAISRAYYLESNIASYPRIVIGPHLIDYLMSFEEADYPEDERIIVDGWLSHIRSYLENDTDGVIILSYLSPTILESYKGLVV